MGQDRMGQERMGSAGVPPEVNRYQNFKPDYTKSNNNYGPSGLNQSANNQYQ